MSRTQTQSPTRPDGPDRPRYGRTAGLAIGGMVAVAALVALLATFDPPVAPPADAGGAFETSGTAAAGGVVVEGAEIGMGAVPLDVTVTPTWTLTNAGTEAVTLGEPHATVVDGCCPGPLTLATTNLAPGDSTSLAFPLQMHPGMDGAHDFDVHVPVGPGDENVLTLSVTGDFGATS